MNAKEIEKFLLIAKKETYASVSAPKVANSRLGSKDYEYTSIINNQKMTYHDTYFGGTKFMGEEVMDNALRPALMQVGIDKKVLPVRGPSKFEQKEFFYTFESSGTFENFMGVERIYKNDTLIYELHCHGGIIK